MKELLKKFLPDFILYWYHWKMAFLAAIIFGWPSRKIKVIGVTGTKGKSTVVYLAGRILNEKIPPNPPFTKGGTCRVGWISSLTINDGKKEVMNPYHMTMPGRFFIQKTLRRMVKNGCEYAVIEVTSEGIKQHRHRFIKWANAVFINLAPEHIEAHGGFDNYRKSKEKLFAAAAKNNDSFGVYNLDDENVGEFLKYDIRKKYGYGKKCQNPNDEFLINDKYLISNVKLNSTGSEFAINGVNFKIKLLGEFNVYNCAAAAITALACGVSLEDSARILEKIQSIPGRLEIINEGQDFSVVVDLAHTPDSFAKVFKLFNELKSESAKIIAVFGSAGGGRDKWKRPELGKIASQYSGQIFITNEDPYDEDPLAIANEILTGCDKNKADIILDRREAIAHALGLAQPGDIVLILGKGTEQSIFIGNKKLHWDDRKITREELYNLKAKN